MREASLSESGSTDVALDLMSRVVMDRMTNLGRTMRLLIDGFSHKMSSEVSYLSTAGLDDS